MSRIPRYEIVSRIDGDPSSGHYKAKDTAFNRIVTLKTIRLDEPSVGGLSPDERRIRLSREAAVLAQLKHPNIVVVYDLGIADDVVYMVMEFLDGPGLDKLIAGGALSVDRAATIGEQVADALDFVHRRNVIHRNINPANIIILEGDRVRITDFSMATVIKSREQEAVAGSLDGRSDLFSLGCVLYEMVTGRKPFHAAATTNLILKIIAGEPLPIHAFNAAVPNEMLRIIGKAMAKAPEARYQTGREPADDLRALA